MAGIRVSSAIKKIEVNDNGDCITLNFSDNSFPDRFFLMLERVEELAEQARLQEEAEQGGTRPLAALYRKLHEGIMDEVDALFGAGTCEKVFGPIVPGIELFDDFFTQLLPYFEEYSRERAARLSKYSAERTGNV